LVAIFETQVAELDPFDPSFHPNSAAVRAARDANWYAHTNLGPAVLRYEDVATLLRDRRLHQGAIYWLAMNGITEGPLAEWWAKIIATQEGHDHVRLLRLVSPAFARRNIDGLVPRMDAIAHQLIDELAGQRECDFMAAFANRFPSQVIMDMFGIDPDAHPQFSDWANDLGLAFSVTVVADRPRIEAAIAGLHACVDVLVEERRRHPGDDLLSALVAARDESDRLSDDELRVMVSSLIFAAQDTTRNVLGLGLLTFIDHPEQWSLLAAHPELAPTAVEEILRLNPAVPLTTRIAIEDFTHNGLDIPAGTFLILFLASGNTDPAVFGDAPFDITATRRPHLTFGGGVHSCTGSMLAQLELRRVWPILARRLGQVELAGTPTWRAPVGVVGPITLPIRFTGAPGLAAA
jgi:cytochrome P450